MVLIATSAWVEFLRGTGSAANHRVRELLGTGAATTDVVVMEVLAGARDELHLLRLRRLLASCVPLVTTERDFHDAAAIYRTCRRRGTSPRSLLDCVVAAVAIRTATPLCEADRDFPAIAAHVPLLLDAR